jgi:hypothetical protein
MKTFRDYLIEVGASLRIQKKPSVPGGRRFITVTPSSHVVPVKNHKVTDAHEALPKPKEPDLVKDL